MSAEKQSNAKRIFKWKYLGVLTGALCFLPHIVFPTYTNPSEIADYPEIPKELILFTELLIPVLFLGHPLITLARSVHYSASTSANLINRRWKKASVIFAEGSIVCIISLAGFFSLVAFGIGG